MSGLKRPSSVLHDESDVGESHEKRQRQVRSCLPCRERKVACDKCHPCTSCVRYRSPQNCLYLADHAVRHSTAPQTVPHQHLSHGTNSPSRSSSFASPPPKLHNVFAKGRLAAKPSKTMYYIGPTAWSVAAPIDIFHHDYHIGNTIQPEWRRLLGVSAAFGTAPYDTVLDPNPHVSNRAPSLLAALPDDDQCQISVTVFFNAVQHTYPILDRARFELALRHFFANNRTTGSEAWIGLLAAVVVAGHVLRTFSASPVNNTPLAKQACELASLIHAHAQTYQTTTYRPGLETFQTMLILIVIKKLRFGWMDGTNGTSGLLGAVNRLVFTMGLHRDPNEALNLIPTEDALLRRKLFAIYLYLEFEHSLQTGMPFLLRASDFDTDFDPRHVPQDCLHLQTFMQSFQVFSQILQLTHSSRSNTSIPETTKLFAELQAKSRGFTDADEPPMATMQDLIRNIQSYMIPMMAYRVEVGLFALTVDKPEVRNRYKLQDLLTPALCVLEKFLALFQQINHVVPADSMRMWKIFVISLFRPTLYNSVGYILHFMQRSLFDESLLACRGTLPTALDSTRIFRKIHLTLETLRCTFDVSIQCIRENTTQMTYLRYVEERHQRFIENGTEHFDVTSAEGKAVTDSMCATIDSMLHEAENALGLGHNGISPSQIPLCSGQPDPKAMSNMTNMPFGDGFSLSDDWDWLWAGDDFGVDWLQASEAQHTDGFQRNSTS